MTSYVDPAGSSTVYGYDGHGDLTQITTPAGSVTKLAYANAASGDYRVTGVTRLVHPGDPSGPTRSYAYYMGGSPCSSSDEGRTVESNERGNATTYCYDQGDPAGAVSGAAANEVCGPACAYALGVTVYSLTAADTAR